MKRSETSPKELAKALKISLPSSYKIISGANFPTIEKLILISEIFGVSLDDLIKKDLSQAISMAKEPTPEYQKVENVNELTEAIKALTEEMRKQKGTL